MKTEIFKNYSEFLNREDKDINGVSPEFVKDNENYQADNNTNEDCWNCRYCSACSEKKGEIEGFYVPEIEEIHQSIEYSASQPNALNMGNWHTCSTTHCRAGWVVHLAGEEGLKLEAETSTAFSAMMIYKKSSDIRVSPNMFYASDEDALKDMKRCAELEASQQDKGE